MFEILVFSGIIAIIKMKQLQIDIIYGIIYC